MNLNLASNGLKLGRKYFLLGSKVCFDLQSVLIMLVLFKFFEIFVLS